MSTDRCRQAVYTILLGNYETLLSQPALASSSIKAICFTDDPTLVSEDWKVVYVERRFPGDVVRSQRALKVRFHEFLSEYEEILYIDNSVQLRVAPELILDEWLIDADMTLMEHSFRGRLIDEFDEVAKLNYDDAVRVHEQLWDYARTSPEVLDEKPFWTGMMARRNVPEVTGAMELWYEHILRYSRRDQLSILVALRGRKFRLRSHVCNNAESEWHTWAPSASRIISQGKRPPLPPGPVIADLLRATESMDLALEENLLLNERVEAKVFALEESRSHVETLQRELTEIQQSHSWRATAILRRVMNVLRRPSRG
jgi:hypothetical protein